MLHICKGIKPWFLRCALNISLPLECSTMKAYVTLLSTANYLPGVLALNESLRRCGTRFPLHVALSRDTTAEVEVTLRKLKIEVIRLSDSLEIPEFHRHSNGHWGNTFDKIQLFGIIKYEKLVYVDSDMMVLQNLDHLFLRPHLSAAAAGRMLQPDSRRLNSGIMVIEPDANLPNLIVQKLEVAVSEVAAMGVSAVGDQDLINAYYSQWPDSPELHLPDSYNVFQFHVDDYILQQNFVLGRLGDSGDRVIKVVHFIGAVKPWMAGATLKHYISVLKRWRRARYLNFVFRRYTALLRDVQRQTQAF